MNADRDAPPSVDHLTEYDRRHLRIYLRLLDAVAEEVDWREVAAAVLGLDSDEEPERVRRVHEAHLARARWMTQVSYHDLLSGLRLP